MSKLLKNRWVQNIILLIVGVAIGSIFYPSKTEVEEMTRKYEERITRLNTEKTKLDKKFSDTIMMYENEIREVTINSERRLFTLKEENTRLKSKITEKKFKIVKPDGTIEERWFKESETDMITSTVTKIRSEFTRKVKEIENKWKVAHEKRVAVIKADYEKKLAESESRNSQSHYKRKTEINKRRFGVSFGLMTNNAYYSNISYDIFGPVFLDLHLQSDKQFQNRGAGLGIGLRF